MKISYNWLKWYIPEIPPAEKLEDIFNYHLCEMESLEKKEDGDTVFDLKILPNRAHDLLSHLGVARELSSLLDLKFNDPKPKYKIPEVQPTKLKIDIQTKKDRRHVGRIVRNIKVAPSPDWIVKHLASIGQRSINNIVDATNLVMFNCGQPTHAFDLAKVSGESLVIRDAKDGEKITLLTGEEKVLKEGMIAICDEAGHILDTGIKGGKHAEINFSTTSVLLEADNFDPVFARKTGQALNIFTDARKRFENDLSPELAPYAMFELSALIAELCPEAIFEEVVDTYPKKQPERKLNFSAERISSILGLKVSEGEIEDILKRYNFEYKNNEETFELTVPFMRLDLETEEDMAEEIGRVIGYDKLKAEIPKINFKPKVNEEYEKIQKVREFLLSQGYSEVMTYVFRDKGQVEVMQSASDKKFLRTNLSDGLSESLKLNKLNAPILGMKEIKIFEVGTVWTPEEEIHIAYNDKDKIIEKKLEEASPEYFSSGPRGKSPDQLGKTTGSAFKIWSFYPFISRDISVWMPKGESSEDLKKLLQDNATELLIKEPELVDSFTKGEQTSYAFRLVFQSFDRTLTDAEVNEIMSKITKKISEKSGWQVR
jgi:phenylalanyl-tRNA synthetase beta chain